MPLLRPHPRPALPRAFAPSARPFAIATLAALALALATLLFVARTLESAQIGAARAMTVSAVHLDLLHELRAEYLRRTTTVWQVALSSDPAQHRASAEALRAQREQALRLIEQLLQQLPPGDARTSVEHVRDLQSKLTGFTERIIDAAASDTVAAARIAFTDALPMLYAMVARLDRTVTGQRPQFDEQARAAMHALGQVRNQFVVLACLFGATLALAGLWSSRIPRATLAVADATPPPDSPAPPSPSAPSTGPEADSVRRWVREVEREIETVAAGSSRIAGHAQRLGREAAGHVATAAVPPPGMAEAVLALQQASRQVAAIVSCSHQLNLVTTGAVIEAARSGEAGRYWAIIATELSKVAERNQSAAAEAAVLLDQALLRMGGAPAPDGLAAALQSLVRDAGELEDTLAGLRSTVASGPPGSVVPIDSQRRRHPSA